MNHKMFVIFDSKAGAYFPPWFLMKEPMALRAFGDCCNDAEHNFGRHPEDFTLFCIGEFDDQTARVEWIAPVSLGNGIEFVVQLELSDDLFDGSVKGDGHAKRDGTSV